MRSFGGVRCTVNYAQLSGARDDATLQHGLWSTFYARTSTPRNDVHQRRLSPGSSSSRRLRTTMQHPRNGPLSRVKKVRERGDPATKVPKLVKLEARTERNSREPGRVPRADPLC